MPPTLRSSVIEQLDDDEILLARSNDTVVGAMVWRLGQDKTAFIWFPVVAPEAPVDPDQIYAALLQTVAQKADDCDAWFTQCLLNQTDTDRKQQLLANGFEDIATLRTLQRQSGFSLLKIPSGKVQPVSMPFRNPADQERMANLIERVRIGSLDCPKISMAQTGTEAIQSHWTDDTTHWRFYQLDGEDVGVLLASTADSMLSIDYMGVIGPARGQGIGIEIIKDAIATAEANELDIEVSVDTANQPASRIYAASGFETIRYLDVIGRLHPDRRFKKP